MKHFTKKDYWDDLYKGSTPSNATSSSRLKAVIKRVLGKKLMDLLWPYDDYLLWQVVLPKIFPQGARGRSVVEIGSAPGHFLVRFANTLGAEPFGVEYTRHGVDKNRAIFEAAGFNAGNVIEADFFSNAFLDANLGRFDIVVSRGFIEHFDDVKTVVERHLAIAKDGGVILIIIPNLLGIYYPWTKIFNSEQLPLHNLEIMKIENFRNACAVSGVEVLRCGYFGTFSFWMFTAPTKATITNGIIRLLHYLQRCLNVVFRLLFSKRGFESSFFSPNLIFIARKSKNDHEETLS